MTTVLARRLPRRAAALTGAVLVAAALGYASQASAGYGIAENGVIHGNGVLAANGVIHGNGVLAANGVILGFGVLADGGLIHSDGIQGTAAHAHDNAGISPDEGGVIHAD